MIINTVEALKSAVSSLRSAGVKAEYMFRASPTTITAEVNVDVDKLPELEQTLSNVDVEVTHNYPITRTVDVKLSMHLEDDWLLQSIAQQEIPTVSIKY